MYYGSGFTHSDVYGMPVYLRRFYLSLLKDAKESENKTRSKKISNFFLKSKLSEKDKYDILKKTMIKLDVSIEDQKEIMQHLSRLKRMNIEKYFMI